MNQRFLKKSTPILLIALTIAACTLSLPTPPPLAETATFITPETSTPEMDATISIHLETPSPTADTLSRIEPEIILSSYRLPDGSELYNHPGTEIEITKLSGFTADSTGHEITLKQGQVHIISRLPVGEWFTVVSSNGHIARVKGSIILVDFNTQVGLFTVVCIEGICELGLDFQQLLALSASDRGWFDADGNFLGPFDVNLDDLRMIYGELIPVGPPVSLDLFTETPSPTPTPSPTSTPSPTPDLAASATAACEQFQVEFPGTPCP